MGKENISQLQAKVHLLLSKAPVSYVSMHDRPESPVCRVSSYPVGRTPVSTNHVNHETLIRKVS